jgi:hypothetical protein
MDEQLWTLLQLIFDILQSTLFFIFVYGMKTMTWISQTVDITMNDDAWLTKVALMGVILLLSLQALRMAYRGFMFWIRFMFNFVFVVGSIAVVLWFWSRGFDGAWEDVGILAQFWTEQYHKYEGQVRTSKDLYDVVQKARDAIVTEQQRAARGNGGRFW